MKQLLTTLILALLLASCQKKESGFPENYTQEEIDDFNYVMSLSDHNENFIFDHSDDRQHRYFLAHLKKQGYTEESNPGLYKSLQDLRKHHQQLRSEGHLRMDGPKTFPDQASLLSLAQSSEAPVSGTGVVTASVGDGSTVPIQIVSSMGMVDANTAVATSLSSISSTAYYSQNSIQLLNDTGPIGDAATEEEYYGGAEVTAKVAAAYTGNGTLAAKMTYYYKLDETSQPVTGQFIASCSNCLQAGTCPSFSNIEPIGPAGQKSTITVCIYRNSQQECTYWYNNPSSHTIIFPVKGSTTFAGKTIQVAPGTNKVQGGSASIWITNNESGGGCIMTSSANFFSDVNTVVTNSNTLSWNFDPASFGDACFQSGERVSFVLSLKIPATDGTQMCAYVSNSTVADTAVYVTYEVGPMNIFYGCLAEGTNVTMADGSLKVIEHVEIGEQVLSNREGVRWTVTSNTRGIEPIPSLSLTTSSGEQLILTQDHPVTTSAGIVIGKALKVGMTLFTATGETTIEKLEWIDWKKPVWNLNLGHIPGEEEELTEENSTFFANNIQVGDSRMQQIHNRKHRNKKENVLSHLPESWHQDYLNSLKRENP